MNEENIRWLTTVPASDGNFKIHLRNAETGEIRGALSRVERRTGNITKTAALKRELKKRNRKRGKDGPENPPAMQQP